LNTPCVPSSPWFSHDTQRPNDLESETLYSKFSLPLGRSYPTPFVEKVHKRGGTKREEKEEGKRNKKEMGKELEK
jgi:hypothetical protein